VTADSKFKSGWFSDVKSTASFFRPGDNRVLFRNRARRSFLDNEHVCRSNNSVAERKETTSSSRDSSDKTRRSASFYWDRDCAGGANEARWDKPRATTAPLVMPRNAGAPAVESVWSAKPSRTRLCKAVAENNICGSSTDGHRDSPIRWSERHTQREARREEGRWSPTHEVTRSRSAKRWRLGRECRRRREVREGAKRASWGGSRRPIPAPVVRRVLRGARIIPAPV